MNCRGCGRPISGDWEVCQYCGYSITGRVAPAQAQPQGKRGISTTTIIIIIVVALVVVPLIASAVLYIMVLDFGEAINQTPDSSLVKTPMTWGVKITFAPVSVETQWSDITILLSDGTSTVQWATATANLDDGTTTKYVSSVVALGSLSIYCNVTDLAGNGYVNQGDYFTLTTPSSGTFVPETTYQATIMHDPTAAEICHMSFSG